MTAWIGEWTLVAVGVALHAAIAAAIRRVSRNGGGASVFPRRMVQRA